MLESLDNGKPIRETRAADLPLAVDHFRYFAGVRNLLDQRAQLPAGPEMPVQPDSSTSFTPNSVSVGTFGRLAERLRAAIASTRSNAPNPPTLATTLINAVTGVGAP